MFEPEVHEIALCPEVLEDFPRVQIYLSRKPGHDDVLRVAIVPAEDRISLAAEFPHSLASDAIPELLWVDF